MHDLLGMWPLTKDGGGGYSPPPAPLLLTPVYNIPMGLLVPMLYTLGGGGSQIPDFIVSYGGEATFWARESIFYRKFGTTCTCWWNMQWLPIISEGKCIMWSANPNSSIGRVVSQDAQQAPTWPFLVHLGECCHGGKGPQGRIQDFN